MSRITRRTVSILALAILLFSTLAAAGMDVSRETPVVLAVRLAGPAVVNVSTKQDVGPGRRGPFGRFSSEDSFDKFFRDFFGPFQEETRPSSLGSGVVIDGQKGLILTNEHVVSGGTSISVAFIDEREFEAELVGSDPDSDLAVLHVKTSDKLPALEMADSDDLMIGETVITIGNPFGLNHTVTTGVISATNRSIQTQERTYRDFIQTDASINPGNSGGPLLNIRGQLIGINTAIYSGANGIGFAIPINKAKRIVRDLISYGEVQPVWLGLSLQPLDERLALHFKAPTGRGALITDVDSQGPSANVGLARGDVIVSLDRSRIESLDDYEDIMRTYTVGDTVRLTVIRKSEKKSFDVRLATFPREKAIQAAWERYGLKVADRNIGSRKIVVIDGVRQDSAAYRLGLGSGDILLRINEIQLDSMESFIRAISRYQYRSGLAMVVQRGRNTYRLSLVP